MLELDILNIVPSTVPGTPSHIEVAGDYVANFHGREWIDGSLTRYPFYDYDTDSGSATPPPPYGTELLPATTFRIVGNQKYDGQYTVYTKAAPGDFPPAELVGLNTKIYIRETIATDGVGAELTDGSVTNISTYSIEVVGDAPEVVLEKHLNEERPIALIGRSFAGWGEQINQNAMKMMQHFAGPTSPANPVQGMLWFNTTNSVMYVYSGGWNVLNAAAFGGVYRHDQASASTTWTVTHNFNLIAPYICQHSFFVVRSGFTKPINPADVTYVSPNSFVVTFSSPETGYVLVRS